MTRTATLATSDEAAPAAETTAAPAAPADDAAEATAATDAGEAAKPSSPTRPPKHDATLAAAVELARAAADATSGLGEVGDYLGYVDDAERLGSHRFATTNQGYRGWYWNVVVSRIARSRNVTVCEVELLPGDGALLAPAWVPWAERLAPGDLSATDVLPFDPTDPRLESGYRATGDAESDRIALRELGLGRDRVPTMDALQAAAQRWYDGDRGPRTPGARASSASCETCGFLVPLSGVLGTMFGVCVNEWSPDDGKVVSYDHGCGAHSETDAPRTRTEWPAAAPLVDELRLEVELHASRERTGPVELAGETEQSR